MTPVTAKRMAAEAGLAFWYDRTGRYWVLQDDGMMVEAIYVYPAQLRRLAIEHFSSRYIAPQREALMKLKEGT